MIRPQPHVGYLCLLLWTIFSIILKNKQVGSPRLETGFRTYWVLEEFSSPAAWKKKAQKSFPHPLPAPYRSVACWCWLWLWQSWIERTGRRLPRRPLRRRQCSCLSALIRSEAEQRQTKSEAERKGKQKTKEQRNKRKKQSKAVERWESKKKQNA